MAHYRQTGEEAVNEIDTLRDMADILELERAKCVELLDASTELLRYVRLLSDADDIRKLGTPLKKLERAIRRIVEPTAEDEQSLQDKWLGRHPEETP